MSLMHAIGKQPAIPDLRKINTLSLTNLDSSSIM